MAAPVGPIDNHLVPTPNGVKIPIERIYVYPDGHANVIWAGGNQPLADSYEVVEFMVKLLRRAQQKAARLERQKGKK
jgi:hypothetical protein